MSLGVGVVGFAVLCLAVWIWNLVWRKMGPDGKPLFALVTYVLIAFAGLSGLVVWLVHLWLRA